MLRRFCLFLILAGAQFFAGAQASAGAWPRQKGSGFTSTASQLKLDLTTLALQAYHSAYVEYGLNGRHTLGLDAGLSSDGTTRILAFVRTPWITTKGGNPIASELGFGMIAGQPVIRPGLSWGRGFKSGWMAADALAELAPWGHFALKLDMTLGLKGKRGRMLILRVQNERAAGQAFDAKFAPSIVVPFGKENHIEIGATTALIEPRSYAVKIGLWRDF